MQKLGAGQKEGKTADVATDLCVREQRQVELLLLCREEVASNDQRPWRQTKIVRPLELYNKVRSSLSATATTIRRVWRRNHLCSPEHHPVEQQLHLLPRVLSLPVHCPVVLDRVQNLVLQSHISMSARSLSPRYRGDGYERRTHVPQADVVHGRVTALVAMPSVLEAPVERLGPPTTWDGQVSARRRDGG